jgi:acyl-CoA synthetase (AMP-forming)/AMP-acid ligase II
MTQSVRTPIPWLRVAGVMFIVLLTLGNAAANMLPGHFPTPREIARAEQDQVAAARRARVVTMLAAGDRCQAQVARELARALVYDGRSARAYADDYELRCGADPIVRRWGDAPVERLTRRAGSR